MEDGITKIVLESGNARATIYESVIGGKVNKVIQNDQGITFILFNGDELFISSYTLLKMGVIFIGLIFLLIQPFLKPKDNE